MTRFSSCLVAVAVSAMLGASIRGAQEIVAIGDEPIARELARGQTHRYSIALTAGHYAGLVVEQRGIDVAVQVRAADNLVIADFDDEMRPVGQEPVEIVAATAGTYTIEIAPAPGTAATGRYA